MPKRKVKENRKQKDAPLSKEHRKKRKEAKEHYALEYLKIQEKSRKDRYKECMKLAQDAQNLMPWLTYESIRC